MTSSGTEISAAVPKDTELEVGRQTLLVRFKRARRYMAELLYFSAKE
ncbi:hypothetical protein CLOM621_08176 [Clostridium sp. M62/1]|nr:hypothetical protein CLOM621_08176 [Clostridium sp. M62/1]